MIYEISLGTRKNAQTLSAKIIQMGEFLYNNGYIYLHTDSDLYSDIVDLGVKESKIRVINKDNYFNSANMILQDWCFTRLMQDNYNTFQHSDEGQARIKEIMKIIERGD